MLESIYGKCYEFVNNPVGSKVVSGMTAVLRLIDVLIRIRVELLIAG
jgi:hypothetical protein